jgi:hypothetical protein
VSRSGRRLILLAAAPALALGLTACTSSLAEADLETQAADLLEEQIGARPDVACDEDLEAEVGKSIECVASDPDSGEELPITITVTSVEGDTAEFEITPTE